MSTEHQITIVTDGKDARWCWNETDNSLELHIDGDPIEKPYLTVAGSAEVLRNLAACATVGAKLLSAIVPECGLDPAYCDIAQGLPTDERCERVLECRDALLDSKDGAL